MVLESLLPKIYNDLYIPCGSSIFQHCFIYALSRFCGSTFTVFHTWPAFYLYLFVVYFFDADMFFDCVAVRNDVSPQASAKHISRVSTRGWVVFSMMWCRFPRSRSPAPLAARVLDVLGILTNPFLASSKFCPMSIEEVELGLGEWATSVSARLTIPSESLADFQNIHLSHCALSRMLWVQRKARKSSGFTSTS